jgi:hypothetical protein
VPTIIDFVERNERRPPSDREERRSGRGRPAAEPSGAPDPAI